MKSFYFNCRCNSHRPLYTSVVIMSQRTRTSTNAASSKSKKKAVPVRKMTRSTASRVQKKTPVKTSSPIKNHREQTSPIQVRRQQRLAGLTATTLLQYCTNIRSPSTNKRQQAINKRPLRSRDTSPVPSSPVKKQKVGTVVMDVLTDKCVTTCLFIVCHCRKTRNKSRRTTMMMRLVYQTMFSSMCPFRYEHVVKQVHVHQH
jgi:hypothetical protein